MRSIVNHWGTVAVVLAIVVLATILAPRHTVAVRASNGKTYRVLRRQGCKDSADMLGRLEDTLESFLDDAEALTADVRIAKIRKRWKHHPTVGGLTEVSASGKDAAYTIGKQDIFVCIRGPDGELEPFGHCLYVLYHELSHVCTDVKHHPPIFWANFRWLLEVAERTKHYTYDEHRDATYCGHPLGENVISCVHNRQCKSSLG